MYIHKESTKELKLQNRTIRFAKPDTLVSSGQKLVESSDKFLMSSTLT
jgi:hypothetical protein